MSVDLSSTVVAVMNLRAPTATSDNVEELRRQIESALGSVEEIVKNKAVISVATTPEQQAAALNSQQDELVVFVSIKINKNQEAGEGEGQHQNGKPAANGLTGASPVSNSEAERTERTERTERAGRRKVRTSDCEVTGQAIRPGRRGRRAGRSSTAPSTPVRTRPASLRSSSVEQTKSLEVSRQFNSGLSSTGKY